MIVYPKISPVLLQIGPVKIHWYGVMYLLGFAIAYALARVRAEKPYSPITGEQVGDLIFYSALGVVLGGRIGYMLFYNFQVLIHKPFSLFAVWQGGMSFHGGLLGVVLAIAFYAKKINKPYFAINDFITPLVPIGLGLGRLGNFINGELWGRVTNVPWAMVFPHVDLLPRHPSQLYEFFLEGVFLFIILWYYSRKKRPTGSVTALFGVLYGSFRFGVEFFREPDDGLGFVVFDSLTMGQLLSLPMILIGLWLLWRNVRGAKKCSNI